ncbi:aldo/keto reductase [Nesterenkonia sp. E16_7]|uniref:aldo/keto reductase n=1 Tax=unclassified Nesterenkonia TaxID=2629769 RepID=UPI001A9242FC|nr:MULTISPECIES: aldo/keto reductase [unclassified Nesterenkonia]MBO0596501.1 aldo/keto reductase [Nesterenkonia sp. E16_10]MBO0597847.1 aldo/keto reductase [Nesterenkonia sp. E16_7]
MRDLHQLLNNTIGFGTAPLGNMFREIPEDEALSTVEAAWDAGIRYFDTAPFYGAGLAEKRLGTVLGKKPRDEFLLSTKVGRYMSEETEEKEGLFADGRSNKVITDYTAEATRKSLEQSMQRLGTDRIDFVFVHDISRDFHGDEWIAKFEEARTGAFRVLTEMREQGLIKGWGLGVNTTEPIELAMQLQETPPDLSLSATQYTILQHEKALERMMPNAQAQGVGIIVGGPYNSGALLGGDYFDYAEAPQTVKDQVAALSAVAARHEVDLKAAALQFSTAHPATVAVIPGSSRPGRISEDLAALSAAIPGAFWDELVQEGLISPEAPLPKS